MNAEKKFRLWDDKNKTWLLGYELPNLGGFSMFGETMLFGEYSRAIQNINEWDFLKLMQFTGMQDIKDKDIYEGDIFAYGVHLFEVTYRAPSFTAYCLTQGSLHGTRFPTLKDYEPLEIIGNIWENPRPFTGLAFTYPTAP